MSPGTSRRTIAITAPGTVLSQPTMQISPSKGWLVATSSIESAITSRLTSEVRIVGIPCV